MMEFKLMHITQE